MSTLTISIPRGISGYVVINRLLSDVGKCSKKLRFHYDPAEPIIKMYIKDSNILSKVLRKLWYEGYEFLLRFYAVGKVSDEGSFKRTISKVALKCLKVTTAITRCLIKRDKATYILEYNANTRKVYIKPILTKLNIINPIDTLLSPETNRSITRYEACLDEANDIIEELLNLCKEI